MTKNRTRKSIRKNKKNRGGGAIAPGSNDIIKISQEEQGQNPATTQGEENQEANTFADDTISDWESIEEYIKNNPIAFDEKFIEITKRFDDRRAGIATRTHLIDPNKLTRLLELATSINPIITNLHIEHDAKNKITSGKRTKAMRKRKRARSRKWN
jgi:hypothetical protein